MGMFMCIKYVARDKYPTKPRSGRLLNNNTTNSATSSVGTGNVRKVNVYLNHNSHFALFVI